MQFLPAPSQRLFAPRQPNASGWSRSPEESKTAATPRGLTGLCDDGGYSQRTSQFSGVARGFVTESLWWRWRQCGWSPRRGFYVAGCDILSRSMYRAHALGSHVFDSRSQPSWQSSRSANATHANHMQLDHAQILGLVTTMHEGSALPQRESPKYINKSVCIAVLDHLLQLRRAGKQQHTRPVPVAVTRHRDADNPNVASNSSVLPRAH